MTTINLELKNIKHMESLSEETNCYRADLYLDGKKVAAVSNHGHGGCDNEHWFDRAAEATVHAYFKSLPERAASFEISAGVPYMMQPTLEDWCSEILTEWLIQRDYKRQISRKVVTTDGKSEWSWKVKPAQLGMGIMTKAGPMTYREHILSSRPGTVIVNDMTPAELAAHIAKMVAKEAA